jgi:hypothetical protein
MRRAKLREPVLLRLRSDLQPNDRHPLTGLGAEQRGEQREKIIASILARLANGNPPASVHIVTMEDGTG